MISNYIHDIGTQNSNCPAGEGGIFDAFWGGYDNDLLGNIIARIGPSGCSNMHGIDYAGQGGHILNNLVSEASGDGIQCWHACTGVTIANNTVFNNGNDGIFYGAGDAPGDVVCDNMIVTNNIAYMNAYRAVREYAYSGQESDIGSHNLIANNLSYGNGLADFRRIQTTPTNSVLSDPQFVSYQGDGTGDYHLLSSSPAVGAGTSAGAPLIDCAGVCRPASSIEIGAYQGD